MNIETFWSKVDKTGDCWLWTGGTQGPGYGRVWLGKRRVLAHRLAYELLVGPIPGDLSLDHLCRNPSCVNPTHLEPVPSAVNVLRGQGAPAQNARKTHCKRGHPLSGANLKIRPDGRECRACMVIHSRNAKARRRAVVFASRKATA